MNKNLLAIVILALSVLSCAVSAAPINSAPTANKPVIATLRQNPPVKNAATRFIVVADVLNVRRGAGTGFSKVGDLQDGAEVSVIGLPTKSADGGTWVLIVGDGIRGYVNYKYLEIAE